METLPKDIQNIVYEYVIDLYKEKIYEDKYDEDLSKIEMEELNSYIMKFYNNNKNANDFRDDEVLEEIVDVIEDCYDNCFICETKCFLLNWNVCKCPEKHWLCNDCVNFECMECNEDGYKCYNMDCCNKEFDTYTEEEEDRLSSACELVYVGNYR